MEGTKTRFGSVRRQLEAYEESWKAPHEEALRCYEFEDALAVGIKLFEVIQKRHESWRAKVEAGLEKFSPEVDREITGLYRWWFRPCQQVLKQLDAFEQQFGVVEGAGEFRHCCDEAQAVLEESGWAALSEEALQDWACQTDCKLR